MDGMHTLTLPSLPQWRPAHDLRLSGEGRNPGVVRAGPLSLTKDLTQDNVRVYTPQPQSARPKSALAPPLPNPFAQTPS